jgi:hypothetical protein
MRTALACAASLQLLALAPACLAEDGDKQRPFTQLIADGYEIKAVTLNPAVQEGGPTANHIVVTLQKDKSVAVCTFAPGQWEALTDSVLAEAKWCDVR